MLTMTKSFDGGDVQYDFRFEFIDHIKRSLKVRVQGSRLFADEELRDYTRNTLRRYAVLSLPKELSDITRIAIVAQIDADIAASFDAVFSAKTDCFPQPSLN